jgi:hypothetical protein
MAKAKKSTFHICSECFGEFETKQIFVAPKPKPLFEIEYSTLYCEKCLTKLGIKESYPYQKTKVKKETVKKVKETKEKTPAKKSPVKKSVAKKAPVKKAPVKKPVKKKE